MSNLGLRNREDLDHVSFERYLAGVLGLLLVIVPVGAASHAWVSRLRPDWVGAIARLAEIVVGLAVTLCVLELLGSISLFRAAAVIPVLAVVGTIGWWAARSTPADEVTSVAPDALGFAPGSSRSLNIVAVFAVGLVAADWATRTIDAYHHGITNADSLWYHMPLAARFVQDGSITPLHFLDLELVTAFYPANSELFHGMGILAMGNDVLSPLLNLGWLVLVLLAGWCVGRPFGTAPVTLCGAAALMATPLLVATQPGGGYDDVVGLALLLACAAILINDHGASDRNRLVGIAIAALAAGLALGTKLTFIVPIGALTVGVFFVARRGRRLIDTSIWVASIALTGSFWYVRNWVEVGNPVPSVHVKAGPFSLPSPEITTPTTTVAHFITQWTDWRQYFLPGFRLAFGPAWWALLGLAAIGLIAGSLKGSNATTRMLAGVGLVTVVGFVITPQVLATAGAPVFFVDNVRYVDPAIVIGLVLLPSVPSLTSPKWRWALLATFAALIVAAQFDGTIWPFLALGNHFAPPIRGWDSLVGLLIGAIVMGAGILIVGRRDIRRWRPANWMAIVAVSGVSAVGFGLQGFYLEHRYTDPSMFQEFTWAQSISGSRIGVAGSFAQLQYALYGRNLSNYVQYIGAEGDHGSYAPVPGCSQWRQQINDGHYRYIVTTGFASTRREVFTTPNSYTVWTGRDPVSVLVHRRILTFPFVGAHKYLGISVFRLNGKLNVSACSSAALQSVKHTPS